MQNITKIVLSLCLALSPLMLLAQSSEKSKLKSRDQIREAAFRYMVAEFAMVTSFADYDRLFLSDFNNKDRAYFKKALGSVKPFPMLEKKGSVLKLSTPLNSLQLEWDDPLETKFKINGVAWEYQFGGDFESQAKALEKKLRSKKISQLFEQLLPSADAGVGALIPMLLGLVVGTAGSDVITELWCKARDAGGISPSPRCIEIKKAKEQALFKDAPALDAVANKKGSDKRNVLARWEAEDWQCPSEDDGHSNEYHGRIRAVKVGDGKKEATSDWFYVKAKFDKDGQPTDIIITRNHDYSSDEKTNHKHLVVHIVFDPSVRKPMGYRIPNKDYNPQNPFSKPVHTLTESMDLKEGQPELIALSKDVVAFTNYRNYRCVVNDVVAKQSAGIDPDPTPSKATK